MYALILGIVGLLIFVASRFRAATPGLALVGAAFAIWVGLGLSGNWYRARVEIVTLVAAAWIFLAGRTAAQTTETMSLTWRALIWSWLLFAVLALVGPHHKLYRRSDAIGRL